jgi:hypothetical protein
MESLISWVLPGSSKKSHNDPPRKRHRAASPNRAVLNAAAEAGAAAAAKLYANKEAAHGAEQTRLIGVKNTQNAVKAAYKSMKLARNHGTPPPRTLANAPKWGVRTGLYPSARGGSRRKRRNPRKQTRRK